MDEPQDVPALLADVAAVGPFFAVATGPVPPGGEWTDLRALAASVDSGRGDPLRARIAAVRAALGTDGRVAASTAFQGLAAQVVAPLFAAVVLHGALPVPPAPGASWRPVVAPGGSASATCDHEALGAGPGTATRDHDAAGTAAAGIARALHWRPGGAGPWLWWAGDAHVVHCTDAGFVDVLAGVLGPLVAAVRARVSVSGRVLWGDAASAVASARQAVCAARPAASARATDVAARLLTAVPLAATATLRPPEPPDASWTFRRRSCCLYYRVPGGGVCADCVLLDRRPRRR